MAEKKEAEKKGRWSELPKWVRVFLVVAPVAFIAAALFAGYYLLPLCDEGTRIACADEPLNARWLLAGVVALVGIGLAVWRGFTADRQVETSQKQLKLAREQADKRAEEANKQLLLSREQVEKTHQHNLEDQFIKALGLLDEDNSLLTRLAGVSSMVNLGVREPKEFAQRCMDALCGLNLWMGNVERPASEWSDFTSQSGGTYEEVVSREVLKTIRNIMEQKRPDKVLPLNFNNRYMRGAHLYSARLERADFTGAHLEGADFTGAHLEGASFFRARLERARFVRARLERADFLGSYLKRARFVGAYLERASFTGAYLERANFTEAYLERARFVRAHLENTDFVGAHLESADFTGAHLEGTRFYMSVLKEEYFWEAISQAQLGGGVFVIEGNERELVAAKVPDEYEWLSEDETTALQRAQRGRAGITYLYTGDFCAFKRKGEDKDEGNNETTSDDDA